MCPYLGGRVNVRHGTRVENILPLLALLAVSFGRCPPQRFPLAGRPTLEGKAQVSSLVGSSMPGLPTCPTRRFFLIPSFRAATPRPPRPDLHRSRVVVLWVAHSAQSAEDHSPKFVDSGDLPLCGSYNPAPLSRILSLLLFCSTIAIATRHRRPARNNKCSGVPRGSATGPVEVRRKTLRHDKRSDRRSKRQRRRWHQRANPVRTAIRASGTAIRSGWPIRL